MPPQNNRMEPTSITTNATQGLGGPDLFFLVVRRRLLRCRVGSDEFDAIMLLLAAAVELAGRCFIVCWRFLLLVSHALMRRIGISASWEPVRTNTSLSVLNDGLKETRRFLKVGWEDRPNTDFIFFISFLLQVDEETSTIDTINTSSLLHFEHEQY